MDAYHVAQELQGMPQDASRAPLLFKAMWISGGTAAVVVSLRVYTQLRVFRKLGLTDYLMILALVGCEGVLTNFGHPSNECF